jgi:hypothetical protein
MIYQEHFFSVSGEKKIQLQPQQKKAFETQKKTK